MMGGILYEYGCPQGHKQTEMRRLKDRDAILYCDQCAGSIEQNSRVIMDRIIFHATKTTFKFNDRTSQKRARK